MGDFSIMKRFFENSIQKRKARKSTKQGKLKYGVLSKIWNSIRNIKIQTRLMVSFIILSSFPLLITGYFAYEKSSSAIKSKISSYSLQLINQVGKNIDDQLARLVNDSISIEFSELVQYAMINHESMTEWEKLQLYNEMYGNFTKNFSYLNFVSDVLIINNKHYEILVYGDMNNKLKINREYIEFLFQKSIPFKGVPVWTAVTEDEITSISISGTREKEGIFLSRAIRGVHGDRDSLLLINIRAKLFEDIYKHMDMGTGADIFVVNSEGVVMSSINPDITFSEQYEDKELIQRVTQSRNKGGEVFDLDLHGEQYMVAMYPIDHADWYVVSTIPYSYLNHEPNTVGWYIFLLAIICFFLAMILSLIISKTISAPLSKLIISMNDVQKGKLDATVTDDSHDEVAEVTKNYNAMLIELKNLIEEVKNKEIQKRKAEFKALQAQINPHFLSNTLNTIRSMAIKQKVDNIADIITSLIKLLRVCIMKGDELIFIHEEIEYIKSYLKIQEYKYYNNVDVHFDIDEEILQYKIPRFLCQPIVENAIIHGIGLSKTGRVIVIKGYREEHDVKISVLDNGAGIPPEKINIILNDDSNKSRLSGIGIKNVEERIKMLFGDNYGIHIESEIDLFTNVEITIPMIKDEGEEC